MDSSFQNKVISIIKKIPRGRVATYGQIAAMAGDPRGARQVSWILHSLSDKYNLPWHRVINRVGTISLRDFDGYNQQRDRLESEGVEFIHDDKIDLAKFGWKPSNDKQFKLL